jgi:phospholipid transport system substrate-binding protein
MVYPQTMFTPVRTRLRRREASADRDVAAKYRSALSSGVVHLFMLAAALCAAGVLIPGRARAQASAAAAMIGGGDPTAMVKAVIDQATAVVRDTQTPTAARDKRLREIAEANFDFPDMARTTLGYHWRGLTPQQQSEFVQVFTSFMENVYLSKLQEYGVQKIRNTVANSAVNFTGQQFDGADYAEVRSTVMLKDQAQPIKVDYLVRRDGTAWKIYDLNIDAISVMANYRQQFNRVLNNDGYPALISLLKKKVAELGSTLDK